MTTTASYSRYSSDGQRAESIEDQERAQDDELTRLGLPAATHRYRDYAISGADNARPDYLRMVADAEAGKFDVLILYALSRLGRDQPERELIIRKLEFIGVRIIAIYNGYDSSQPANQRKATRFLSGFTDEAYLDSLREDTRRGLRGVALKGRNAGGKSYGYKHIPIEHPTEKDEYGRPRIEGAVRQVDPEQAPVVQQIFAWFAEGKSPYWIASELNRQGIPSPRGGKWARSAIYGDRNRSGVGILNNPLYNGRYIWNRSQWVKDPTTGKRKRRERPESEWIIQELPELKIIDDKLWEQVQHRMQAMHNDVISESLKGQNKGGRKPRYLLSGLMVCGECGARYTMVNRKDYGCASRRERGKETCSNGTTVRRQVAETRLLAGIKQELLTDEAIEEFRRATSRYLREAKKQYNRTDHTAELAKIDKEITNLTAAIGASGHSEALITSLKAAETRKARIQEEAKQAESLPGLPDILPKATETYRRMVSDLENVILAQDVPQAQQALTALLGPQIKLIQTEDGGLVAEVGIEAPKMVALATGTSAETVVAGTGYGCFRTLVKLK